VLVTAAELLLHFFQHLLAFLRSSLTHLVEHGLAAFFLILRAHLHVALLSLSAVLAVGSWPGAGLGATRLWTSPTFPFRSFATLTASFRRRATLLALFLQ